MEDRGFRLKRIARARKAIHLAAIVAVGAPGALSCAEPCSHTEPADVPASTNPFADRPSVFSVCGACPSLPASTPGEASGPATLCDVSFSDTRPEADVLCLYGPGGTTSTSLANGAVTGVANLFTFCKDHCPNFDALHSCSIAADTTGVTRFSCTYGRTCG